MNWWTALKCVVLKVLIPLILISQSLMASNGDCIWYGHSHQEGSHWLNEAYNGKALILNDTIATAIFKHRCPLMYNEYTNNSSNVPNKHESLAQAVTECYEKAIHLFKKDPNPSISIIISTVEEFIKPSRITYYGAFLHPYQTIKVTEWLFSSSEATVCERT
uniref:Uncharacterized protein n=1 Tax=Glossina brevipalpis TaxID=37001 RepID=A0A1A9WGE1_9MUSC